MRQSHLSLKTKLLIPTLGFLGLLAVAMLGLVLLGFNATQHNAADQSVAGLDAQGRSALRELVDREAQITSNYIRLSSDAATVAAQYLGSIKQNPDAPATASQPLTRADDGHVYDSRDGRRSDLFIPNFVAADDPATLQDVRASAALDDLVPSIMARNKQAIAAYYVSPRPITRFYPSGTLEGITPADINVTNEPWYAPTAPEQNPERKAIWSPLYLDVAGNGLMTTTCSPVYVGETFDGVFCIDVTLTDLIAHMNTLKLTRNTFAFLTDADGNLFVGPPQIIKSLTGFDTIPLPAPDERTTPIGSITDQREHPPLRHRWRVRHRNGNDQRAANVHHVDETRRCRLASGGRGSCRRDHRPITDGYQRDSRPVPPTRCG